MVAEAGIAGLGLEVVRAALDSERHKHAEENRALRRAARIWKTRAQKLDSRVSAMRRELRDVRGQNKVAVKAREDAEDELQRVQSECATLRGFKSRILASISTGTVTLNQSVVGDASGARRAVKGGSASASPCGTVVGGDGDRRRSLTASDKIRNWEADDAVCAEEQELARKVEMMRGWDPCADRACSIAGGSNGTTGSAGQNSARNSLCSVPLSPVASSGGDQGWGKLLDCSVADGALSFDGSVSSSTPDESVGDSGAATRHSTDASGGVAWDGKTHRPREHSLRADNDAKSSIESRTANGVPTDFGRSERAFEWVHSSSPPVGMSTDNDASSRKSRIATRHQKDFRSRSPSPVNNDLHRVLTDLERKAEALQVAQEQRSADRQQYEHILQDNKQLQAQLERAQHEIQQVRCVNEHLVESVNAVRIELRGTPGSVVGALGTPAAAAVDSASLRSNHLDREVEIDSGDGVGADGMEAFSPQIVSARRRLAASVDNREARLAPQQNQQRGEDETDEATTDWATETGSSLSIVATPPSPEAVPSRRVAQEGERGGRALTSLSNSSTDDRSSAKSRNQDGHGPARDTAGLSTATVASADESSAVRRARWAARKDESRSYLSERDQSFLARAAALEARRRASPSALNSSSSSSASE